MLLVLSLCRPKTSAKYHMVNFVQIVTNVLFFSPDKLQINWCKCSYFETKEANPKIVFGTHISIFSLSYSFHIWKTTLLWAPSGGQNLKIKVHSITLHIWHKSWLPVRGWGWATLEKVIDFHTILKCFLYSRIVALR